MILPWHVMLFILVGVFFPLTKIPLFMLTLYFYPFEDILYRNIPVQLFPIFKTINNNYFWWHFGALFGLSYFMQKPPNVEWFTFHSIVYSFIIYQKCLMSQWPHDPILAIVITTTVQYYDGYPVLFALIDNITTIFHPQSHLAFLPDKLAFYLGCVLYDIFRKKLYF